MKTCPICHAAVPPEDRQCRQCGARIDAPDLTPAVVADAPAAREEADAGGPPVCPECQVPWKPETVLCVACGFDARTRRRLHTVHGVEEAPPKPLRPDLGRVRLGLAFHLVRLHLALVNIFLALILGVLDVQVILVPDPAPVLADVILKFTVVGVALMELVLGMVGSVLCMGVPRESRTKGLIVASFALDSAVIPVVVAVVVFGWPAAIASLCGVASWVLFMLFLGGLAQYLDQPEEGRQAMGVLVHGLLVRFVIPILFGALIWLTVPSMSDSCLSFVLLFILLVLATAAWLAYAIKVLLNFIAVIVALRRGMRPHTGSGNVPVERPA